MPALRCSCGEYLLPKVNGITVCWYCRHEYDKKQIEIISMDFEAQQKRKIIRSATVPIKPNSRITTALPLPDGFRFHLES